MPGRLAGALVVLTRPQGRNESLAQRLQQHGLDPLVMPVLEIAPVSGKAIAPPQPQDYDLVVFVSGNAAAGYFQQLSQAGAMPAAWPAHTRVATVGLATAQAVAKSGLMPLEQILAPDEADEQDSESLWKILRRPASRMRKALIVRGQDGREWLSAQLEQAGIQVDRHASYQRRTQAWPLAPVHRLRAGLSDRRKVFCLLTSAHGVQAFVDNAARNGLLEACKGFHYLVIHPRIAGRLQSSLDIPSGKVGEPAVTICSPRDDAIVQAVISLASL